ncbi:MAG: hypothetical protein MO846_01605 [Candidatus Devosia symbiotica]|nr:hypothetical protein [Candidatus Devosia symbiotica]
MREIAKPVPQDDEIVIRVVATSLKLADSSFRKADPFIIRLFGVLFRPKVVILGDAIASAVCAVGSTVTRFKVSECIYGSIGPSLSAWPNSCASRRARPWCMRSRVSSSRRWLGLPTAI